MGKFTIKSKKWYGRLWPPERKKIKTMQALLDYTTPDIEKKFKKAWHDHLIYGTPLLGKEENYHFKEVKDE